jgi:hypothetical protein
MRGEMGFELCQETLLAAACSLHVLSFATLQIFAGEGLWYFGFQRGHEPFHGFLQGSALPGWQDKQARTIWIFERKDITEVWRRGAGPLFVC